MKPKLIINGAAGRMGKRIVALAHESAQFDIVATTDYKECPDLGKDAGELAGIGPIGVSLSSEMPEDADVMIDFTLAPAADKVIEYCQANNIALVMGTTGLSQPQLAKVDQAAGKIPLIQSTNMGVGMNTLFEVVGIVAKLLGDDYDIEIVEEHHRFKKDAPSGSALTLAEKVCEAMDLSFPDALINGREGESLRTKGTIGMHAVRAGDIVGEHSVIYSTLGETVRISHSAHSRDVFVRGAIRAAAWLFQKPAGRYQMRDVLGLKKS